MEVRVYDNLSTKSPFRDFMHVVLELRYMAEDMESKGYPHISVRLDTYRRELVEAHRKFVGIHFGLTNIMLQFEAWKSGEDTKEQFEEAIK